MFDMPANDQRAQGAVEGCFGDIGKQRMLHEGFSSDVTLLFPAQRSEGGENVALQRQSIFQSKITL